jgi:hypothetical protein
MKRPNRNKSHNVESIGKPRPQPSRHRQCQPNHCRRTSFVTVRPHTAASRRPRYVRCSPTCCVAVYCSWGPPFQVQRVQIWQHLGDSKTQVWQGNACHMCVCVKLWPQLRQAVDEDDPQSWCCGRWWRAPRRRDGGPAAASAWMSLARDQECAVAEAGPLEVQPSIHRHLKPLLQIGQLLGSCSCKATPSIWLYFGVSVVGRRQCHSPKIGGGGGFFSRPMWSLVPPPH